MVYKLKTEADDKGNIGHTNLAFKKPTYQEMKRWSKTANGLTAQHTRMQLSFLSHAQENKVLTTFKKY